MIVRKILLAAGAAALMSTPAWGLPSQAPSNQGTTNGPSGTPNNADHGQSGDPHGKGKGKGDHGQGHPGASHKCVPHSVGYVASGALASWTLTKDEGANTYSGEVVVEVTHTNHHAAADKGTTVKYTVTKAHVTFGGVQDANKDGAVGPDDLAKGDRVHVSGKITALAKKCSPGEFKAATTIARVAFHPPAGSKA